MPYCTQQTTGKCRDTQVLGVTVVSRLGMRQEAYTRWEILDDALFVFYGGPGRFSDADYTRWHRSLTDHRITRYLGGTAKGFQLNGAQRSHGRRYFLDNQVPFVTVTDDPVVRGFVTTGAWFGLNIAAFSWMHLDSATERLGLRGQAAEHAQRTLLRLRTSVECRSEASVTEFR